MNSDKNTERIESIYNSIKKNYKASGSEDKDVTFASFYRNKEELNKVYGSIESFENQDFKNGNIHKSVNIEDLDFPIITFDTESTLGGFLFEADSTRQYVLREAEAYFPYFNNNASVWEFEDYSIHEERGLLKFEDKEGENLGYVILNDKEELESIIKGADPIADGWEDGIGNKVTLDGWNNFEEVKSFKYIKEIIMDYEESEFGGFENDEYGSVSKSDIDVFPDSHYPLANTTLGDNEELELQVTLNLEDLRLETEVFNDYIHETEYIQCDSLKEISGVIDNVDFDDFVSLDELDLDDLIDKSIVEANKNNHLVRFTNEKGEEEIEVYDHKDQEQNESLGVFLQDDINKLDLISFAEADELGIDRPLNVFEQGRKDTNELFNHNSEIEM